MRTPGSDLRMTCFKRADDRRRSAQYWTAKISSHRPAGLIEVDLGHEQQRQHGEPERERRHGNAEPELIADADEDDPASGSNRDSNAVPGHRGHGLCGLEPIRRDGWLAFRVDGDRGSALAPQAAEWLAPL